MLTAMPAPRPFEVTLRETGHDMLREAGDYFAGGGRLYETLRRLAARLGEEGIPYALTGGLALGRHRYVRMTDDVDVLVTGDGLERFHERCTGRRYVPTHPGARRAVRDVESGVRIKCLVTGEFPGDGTPKPVAFPDPATSADDMDGLRVLRLPRLVELKLASGMSAPHRLRDLADVQEIIKVRGLDAAFADQLDPSVRARYLELQRAVAAAGGAE
jgi:hypothetical protein